MHAFERFPIPAVARGVFILEKPCQTRSGRAAPRARGGQLAAGVKSTSQKPNKTRWAGDTTPSGNQNSTKDAPHRYNGHRKPAKPEQKMLRIVNLR
ncbi:MAG: hypothetical protein K2G93_06720 [Rikenella sp.]|nr:hypothetical protein [Rikenella sp.]